MMKRHIAVALVVAGVALPACAQRGGRGFATGNTPAFRGGASSLAGFAAMGRSSFMGAPQFRGANPGVGIAGGFRSGTVRGGIGFAGLPAYGYAGASRYRRPYIPYYGVGSGYAIPGWIGPDFLDYPNSGFYNNAGNTGAVVAAPVNYPAEPYDPRPVEQAGAAPDESFRPAYQRPAPEPEPEDAVTLVFKDGRPAEEIHNYMLTRTTLYVQDGRRREIAVADLDLPATEKANRDAGVDFGLPGSGN